MTTIQIDKSDKRLKAVKFLTACMSKNDERFHCKHFKVESDQSAIATDGHRLHWVYDLALAPGYYQVHKNNKTSVLIEKVYELDTLEGSYPDYVDILSIPDDGKTFDIMFQDIPGGCDVSGVYTTIIRQMESTTLNFDYVSDVYSALEGDVVSCIVPPNEKTGLGEIETCKPVHFQRNGFQAVIMPKRV